MKTLLNIISSLAFLALATTALADRKVDETRPASATGTVTVSNVAGSITVKGWDREEVHITGTLSEDVERLDIESDGDEINIEVVVPDRVRDRDGSELVLSIPTASRLEVEAVSADVDVSGISGPIEASSISGNVNVQSRSAELDVSSISGKITVAGSADNAEVEAGTISGSMELTGIRGQLRAETVSGSAKILDSSLRELNAETTSGSLTYVGSILPGGNFDISSISGSVELRLPADVDASFDISAFSGDIDNAFGPEAQRSSEYGPGQELNFTAGKGSARVSIETLSGSIDLVKN